jgi:hypothetical protein
MIANQNIFSTPTPHPQGVQLGLHHAWEMAATPFPRLQQNGRHYLTTCTVQEHGHHSLIACTYNKMAATLSPRAGQKKKTAFSV